jgi:hypothetical protein
MMCRCAGSNEKKQAYCRSEATESCPYGTRMDVLLLVRIALYQRRYFTDLYLGEMDLLVLMP